MHMIFLAIANILRLFFLEKTDRRITEAIINSPSLSLAHKIQVRLVVSDRRQMKYFITGLYDGSTRLLLLCVRWAKSVPTFLQLSFRDQAILLEESWSELFILTTAQLGIPVELLGKQEIHKSR